MTATTSVLRELLGDVLRERRRDQGLTLRDVSERARISLGYISEVERGQKEASSELLAALAQALDVPLSQVMLDVGALLQSEEAAELATVSSISPGEVRASAALMRHTEFWRRMEAALGADYAASWAQQYAITALGSRTAVEALEAGIDPKSVWREVHAALDLPAGDR